MMCVPIMMMCITGMMMCIPIMMAGDSGVAGFGTVISIQG